jgi:hypothetical protein
VIAPLDPAPARVRVLTAECSRRGHGRTRVARLGGVFAAECCDRAKFRALVGTAKPIESSAKTFDRRPGEAARRSHFNAVRTTCALGHTHPSKVEARVCASVYAEYGSWDDTTIYRNVRLPLWRLPPTDAGLPHYCSVDFAVFRHGLMMALIDAKSGRRSRDWERGRAAVEASYGVRVEERSC